MGLSSAKRRTAERRLLIATTAGLLLGFLIHDGLKEGWPRALMVDLPIRFAVFALLGLAAQAVLRSLRARREP